MRPRAAGMRATVSWLLQFAGLVIVGAALLIGLGYDALRFEVGLMGLGGGSFLAGRYLRSSGE